MVYRVFVIINQGGEIDRVLLPAKGDYGLPRYVGVCSYIRRDNCSLSDISDNARTLYQPIMGYKT
jgi:hypothetical protein